LLCLNAKTGEPLWEKSVDYAAAEATHGTNPYCSSSPMGDGERVVAWFGSAGLFCYDLQGKEQWKKDLGAFDHIWGNAASPLIWENLVILNAGPGIPAFVAAFDKSSGNEVWRKEYPEMTSAKSDEFRGSWSTPVVTQDKGQPALLLSLPTRLFAVDPATGNERWSSGGMSKLVYTSPLFDEQTVVAMCGYHGPAIGVKKGGSGDVTETHRLWRDDVKIPQRVGSGVILGEHIYMHNENGTLWCIHTATGERKWEQRIGTGSTWSSLVLAGGKVYALSMQGNVSVLEVSPEKCETLRENKINETTRSSLAFVDDRVFLRTYEHLYCFGKAAE
jgi:outer membrane protein assembly factor BamB